jgi:hypothetical protein
MKVALFLLCVAVASAAPTADKANVAQYAIIVDTGSSGTSASLFKNGVLVGEDGQAKGKDKDCWQKITKAFGATPGTPDFVTSQFAAVPTPRLTAFFDTFVKFAAKHETGCNTFASINAGTVPWAGGGTTDVNLADLKKVKWFFFATAGMREEAANKAKFEALETNAEVQVKAKIISGAVEGFLGYLANKATVGNDKIYLEQGGASAQVAFSCPKTACSHNRDVEGQHKHARRLLAMRQNSLQPNLLQVDSTAGAEGFIMHGDECIYSNSFMGYGGDEISGLTINRSAHPEHCLLPGLTLNTAGAAGLHTAVDEHWHITGGSGLGACPTAVKQQTWPWMKEMTTMSKITNHKSVVQATKKIVGGGGTASKITCLKKSNDCVAAIHEATSGTATDIRGATPIAFEHRWSNIHKALTACSKGAHTKGDTVVVKSGPMGRPLAAVNGGIIDSATHWETLQLASVCASNTAWKQCDSKANSCEHNANSPLKYGGLHEMVKVRLGKTKMVLGTEEWAGSAAKLFAGKFSITQPHNPVETKGDYGNGAEFVHANTGKGPKGGTQTDPNDPEQFYTFTTQGQTGGHTTHNAGTSNTSL